MNMLKKNSGITLIELMISLALGLILAAAAVSIFVGNKQTYKLQEAVASTQENARFAMNVLMTNIRGVSETLASGTDLNIHEVYNMLEDEPDLNLSGGIGAPGIIGYEALDDSTVLKLSAALAATNDATDWEQGDANESSISSDFYEIGGSSPNVGKPIIGRDIVMLNVGDGNGSCGGQVGAFNPKNVLWGPDDADEITATPPFCGLKKCTIAVIVKDGVAAIFMVTDVYDTHPSGVGSEVDGQWTIKQQTGPKKDDDGNWCPNENATQDTSAYNLDGGSLFIPQENGYRYFYIGFNNSNRSSLWTVDGPDFDSPQELVEGVYDMQLTYYQDLDGDNQISKVGSETGDFITAAGVTDWNKVIAVRINLLMESDQAVLDSPQDYTFNGASLTSPEDDDRRFKKAFSLTVAIRNKVL